MGISEAAEWFEGAMTQATASVPKLPIAESSPSVRWFGPYCSVVERNGIMQVFVGGTLVGQFDPTEIEVPAMSMR